jgi:hypothetical protein
MRTPKPPSGSQIRLLHDNSIITSNMYGMIARAVHKGPIEEYFIKKAKWSRSIFNLIHWVVLPTLNIKNYSWLDKYEQLEP